MVEKPPPLPVKRNVPPLLPKLRVNVPAGETLSYTPAFQTQEAAGRQIALQNPGDDRGAAVVVVGRSRSGTRRRCPS